MKRPLKNQSFLRQFAKSNRTRKIRSRLIGFEWLRQTILVAMRSFEADKNSRPLQSCCSRAGETSLTIGDTVQLNLNETSR